MFMSGVQTPVVSRVSLPPETTVDCEEVPERPGAHFTLKISTNQRFGTYAGVMLPASSCFRVLTIKCFSYSGRRGYSYLYLCSMFS